MDYIFNKTSWEPGFDNRPARLYLSQTILKVSKDHFLIISDHPGPIVSHLPGGNFPSPKFVHLAPPISDIYHPQKPYICQEDNCHPQFFFFLWRTFLGFFDLQLMEDIKDGMKEVLDEVVMEHIK